MNSQPIYNIFIDKGEFHITELGSVIEEDIRTIIELGGRVRWNNQGQIREIPNGILADVFETYDFWRTEPENLQVDVPRDVGSFYWGDTKAIHQRPPSS